MDASFSVRNIMLLPVCQQSHLKLIAGEKGIRRAVQHVTVFESKEAIAYMKGGEFLLSGGYNFTREEELQREIVRKLNSNGVAAILIKSGKYFSEIPSVIIQECDALNFPLFELPYNMSYRPIMMAITQGISEAKMIGWTSEMNQLIQFESDEDIVNFCEWIQIKSKHPCVVVDSQNRMYHSQTGAPFEQVILENIDALCQRGSDRKQFEFYFDMEDGTRRQASIFCIKQAKGLVFLILLFEGEPDDKNIDSLGHMGVELLAHMFDDRENQYQRDAERLLRSLHILKQQGLSELKGVTEFFQIQQQDEYRVAVARTQPEDCDKLYEKLARKPCVKVVCRSGADQMILIVDGDAVLSEDLADIIEKHPVWVGVGTKRRVSESMEASYSEAVMAARMAAEHSRGGIAQYEDIGVLHLLSALKDKDILRSFVDKYIRPLFEYDQKHSSQLILTLQSYFAHSLNARATAQALYIGKTTLMYRLSKIEGIMGVNLHDFNDALNLHVALLAAKIYKLL